MGAQESPTSQAKTAIEFANQAEKLGQYTVRNDPNHSTRAVEAKFVTAQDPVVVTAEGGRLPSVPLEEALTLNKLRDEFDGREPSGKLPTNFSTREAKDGTIHGVQPPQDLSWRQSTSADAPLSRAIPPAKTNPLFPPLPLYGPPSILGNIYSMTFRFSSAILSFLFLLVIILGAFFTSIPIVIQRIKYRLRGEDSLKMRPFYDQEKLRAAERKANDRSWRSRGKCHAAHAGNNSQNGMISKSEQFLPTEGGPDAVVCNVGYYARRIGLDCEIYEVQTEDGFILELLHLYNPLTTKPKLESEQKILPPDVFTNQSTGTAADLKNSKYPVLLVHGLLQSAGAYCCSNEDSLAFYLAKSGLDVWLGNNRCGFTPRHTLLEPNDPRMWAWNIRQMGVMDLPALISRVLHETAFPKLALVAHSQGTTQTLVALAKEQRPDIGSRISIACLLAPAAYAGPLIGKMYFKFMRVISPGMFRVMFGIHAFIPFMMDMHRLLPGSFYGFMGYRVFSFLFNWSDTRWDRGLRDRYFQFSPVYVSAESMRWWLGRECFATQRCILATREEGIIEDAEDEEVETCSQNELEQDPETLQRYSWYDDRVPPMAIWVAGSDQLVDGERLLRRLERGREPSVRLVHSKVIPDYEHLDVIWGMDSIDQVGREVLECISKTIPADLRRVVQPIRDYRSCEFTA